jgi:hypothetical protein
MIEEIKLVGSIVGLLTGAYAFWDRLLRGRPLAFIAYDDQKRLLVLRIKNVSQIDVLIIGFDMKPRHYRVSTGSSVREIADAIVDAPSLSVITPGETKDFQFFESPKRAVEEHPFSRVRFVIRWRKANATWIRQIPVWVLTSKADLERMVEASR